MPQVVELPSLGQSALITLVRICKETPAKGEPFRELRSRLRVAKLWDRERPTVLLRFLGIGGAMVMPSLFMQALAAANGEDEIAVAVLDRMWHLNPLLTKTVIDLVTQRAYHKDEIYKHLASASYHGVVPSRPGLETWLQLAIGAGLLRTVGIAVTSGPRADRYVALATVLDVDEFLAEDRPEPEPVIPQVVEEEAAPVEAPADTSVPVVAAAPTGSPLPAPLRHLTVDGVASPRGRDRVVATSRFAQGFSDEILDETRQRIATWWAEVNRPAPTYQPVDFGLDPEAWVEGADEVVYRVAVAAALGRGLFRTELFWIMDMLAKLGVVRYDDLGDFTVTPYRIVRDTLFRLGFLASPYASDAPTLTAAARATRRAVPQGPADEILATFALAAGCAYDCTHRRTCDFPCRERLD